MKSISKQCKVGFCSSFVWGIIAHGIILTNKLSWHDDISELFGLGSTYPSGRWMLEFIEIMEKYLLGAPMYSTPLFNGLMSILCIAIVVALLIDLFELKSEWLCIALAGVMVTFPVITSMFGYMFTAPAYMLGLLMGVCGAYLICKDRKWYTYIAALMLCSCCVGTYQAFISVIVSIFVIYMIKCNMGNQEKNISDMIKEAIYYVISCIGFMIIYFIINKLVLNYFCTVLLDYRGISNMGVTSIKGYLYRIISAYKEFFMSDVTASAHMYPIGIGKFYKVTLIIIAIGSVYCLYKIYRNSLRRGIYVTVLICVLPLATNFVYFMCDIENVHSLMVYGKVFVLVYMIVLLNQIYSEEEKTKQLVAKLGMLFVCIMSIMYVKYDNMCYLKAEIVQTQTIQYISSMVTRIKSVEGYSDELPVIFVNPMEVTDVSITQNFQFEVINIIPYQSESDDLINDYVWNVYMSNWLNYNPVVLSEDIISGHEEVEKMPSYPDDGSIKIIDDIIVIKF